MIALGAVLLSSFDASARPKLWSRLSSDSDSGGWREGSASIVVDGKTGVVLQESNADKLRHPASLTKIMTLYMLFEQIEAGRLKLNSRLLISTHAADAAPTKLDLNPGESIEVEDAIKAVVTRSANDVAIAIGETIGGSEDNFAALMTRKARALGMTSTVFKNASGLPDKDQVTTARDLSILGRAIQDRFPQLYRFFSLKTFIWRGTQIANHNHLINREGVDGIKTGYTRASGFNLVTSVKLRNRYIVAVVLGGASAGARDARMAQLIDTYLPQAYAGERKTPLIAEVPQAIARVAKAAVQRVIPTPGSREPIKPMPVRTVALNNKGAEQPQPAAAPIPNSGVLGTLTVTPFGDVTAGPAPSTQVAAFSEIKNDAPAQVASVQYAPPQPQIVASNDNTLPAPSAPKKIQDKIEPAILDTDAGDDPRPAAPKRGHKPVIEPAILTQDSGDSPAPVQSQSQPQPVAAASMAMPVTLSAPQPAAPVQPETPKPVNIAYAQPAQNYQSGWQVQIGAYTQESEALTNLQAARAKLGGLLARARIYTEKTYKGSVEYVRARFAGFSDETDAKKACEALKRNDFACIPVKN